MFRDSWSHPTQEPIEIPALNDNANFEPFSWKTKDGLKIFARFWPNPDAMATVLIVHGTGDHVGRFAWLANRFQAAGFAVCAADWRGNGLSEGTRGYIPDFATLLNDLDQTIDETRKKTNLPLVLYGQSFGGLLSLYYSMKRDSPRNVAVIASSPALDIAISPPAWKLVVGRTLGRALPRFNLPTGIRVEHLTRDPNAQEASRADKLRHGKICARTFFSMIDTGKWVRLHPGRLQVPTLLMHGDADSVTDHEASIAFANSASTCELKLWPDLLHELHHENEKQAVFDFACEWLIKNLVTSV